MDWLRWLLAIDAPEHASLQTAHLSLRGLFPWWVAILLLVVATLPIWLLYSWEQGRLGIARRLTMVGLRVLAIGLLLFLLLRPVVVAEFHGERPQAIAVVIDNTQSMKQQDKRRSHQDKLRVAIAQGLVPANTKMSEETSLSSLPPEMLVNPERARLVQEVFGNSKLNLLDGLKRHGPLRMFLFGQRLRRLGGEGPTTDEIAALRQQLREQFKADDPRTALSDSIGELLQAKDGDIPAAIVLVTDGQDNASKVPLDEMARECARYKVPLYIYGVGSSEGGNLQLKDAAVPETIFYEDVVSVPVRWRAQGIKQGTVVITLTLGGKVVRQRELPVQEGEDLREVLTFIPRKSENEREEKTDLAVSIQVKDSEDLKDQLKKPVQLIDRRVKVLYIENSPRWEYKFLVPALLRDRRVEASLLLVQGDPKALQAGPPFLSSFPSRDKLFAYDLVILGDVPASYLGTEHLDWLQDFVREGGGLVMIAGRVHAPASYSGTSFVEVLPVEFRPVKFTVEVDARPLPFSPLLTSAGERSDMLALADVPEENQKTWKELPGIYWHYPVSKLRPGATSLLSHPKDKMTDQPTDPMSLAAIHHYGKGQVLFLASEETWRWRYNARDKHFSRFWGQIIYQLGLPHLLGASKRTQVALEHSEALLGRPGHVYAKLFDSDYQPLKDEQVTAQLEFLDGKQGEPATRPIVLEAIPGQPGEYRALLAHETAGRFELKLTHPESAVLPYRVNLPPRHELEPSPLAEEALREAAKISGGKFYREEDLHRLPKEIEPRRAPFTVRQEVLLWSWPALILFVCVVTLEWLVRKFSNLS